MKGLSCFPSPGHGSQHCNLHSLEQGWQAESGSRWRLAAGIPGTLTVGTIRSEGTRARTQSFLEERGSRAAERRAPPGWAPLGSIAQGTGRRGIWVAGAGPSAPMGAPVSEWRGLRSSQRGLSWACGSGGSARPLSHLLTRLTLPEEAWHAPLVSSAGPPPEHS